MKQKNLIMMVLAVGCGLVAAVLAAQINAKPKVDQVEVWVAKKDLAVGTLLAKAELPNLIVKKKVNKDSLPQVFVADENELADKRLSAPVMADQTFNPSVLSNRGVIILPEGKDMISLPMTVAHAAAGFIGPGSKVDVLATMRNSNKLSGFPLLVDMQILAVDTHTSYDSKTGVFPNMSTVSLAVTQEQALLLSMAKERGCRLELLLRNPQKPLDTKYDINRVKKIIQDESAGGLTSSENTESKDKLTPETLTPPVAPTESVVPAPKVEMVKVLKATAEIAENTEITKDLLAQSFTQKEIPKDTSEVLQAFGDLTPYLGQVFKTPVMKDQLVIKGMIGPATTKVPPPDVFTPPKPEPEPKTEPKSEPAPAPELKVENARRTHDLALYTAQGTLIHRYEEIKPGEWRLKQVMTPEEAARETKQPRAPSSPATPATPEKSPEPSGARKID